MNARNVVMVIMVSCLIVGGMVYNRAALFKAVSRLVHGPQHEVRKEARMPEDMVRSASAVLQDCVAAEDEMYDAARLEELATEKYPNASYSLVLLEENMQKKRGELEQARLSLQKADELCVEDEQKYADLKRDIVQILHTVDEFDHMFTSMIEIIKAHPHYVSQRQQYVSENDLPRHMLDNNQPARASV